MDDNVTVGIMARALARAGLSAAYGHCSVRVDRATLLVCAPKPMGLVAPGEPGMVVPIEGKLPDRVLGEVRIHQKIYQRRPDIGAICRFISPNVVALAAMERTPTPRHGHGAYFYPRVPYWPGTALVRTDEAAAAVAETMAGAGAVVLGVNGAVTAAERPERALALAWYLEDAARVELAILACGMGQSARSLSEEEAKARAVWDGGTAERMWAYLTHGDSALSSELC